MVIVSDTQTQWLSSDGWKNVELSWVHPAWNSIDGASWVWPYSLVDSIDKFGPFEFRRSFTIPDDARDITARIQISSDDGFENLRVNGQNLGPGFDYSIIRDYTVQLVPGENVISFSACNYKTDPNTGVVNPIGGYSNPASVHYRIDITYTQDSASVTTFLDTFDDNAIDTTFWKAVELGGPQVVETNQRLEITVPPTSSGSFFTAKYESICRLHGDYDIQVDYALLTWPSASGVRIGITTDGAMERASWGRNEWYGTIEGYSKDFYGSIQVVPTGDLTGKLRIVRQGSTITGYYWNGMAWVSISSGWADTGDVPIGLAVWSHDYAFSDSEVKITFDNFRVNSGELIFPTPTPTPTPTPEPMSVFDLKENLPEITNGENGVYMQYLSGGNYYDLTHIARYGDHWFGTVGRPWYIPCVCLDGDHILAHPSARTQCGMEADTIIRVTIPGNGGTLRVTGQAGEDMGSVRFYIFKGADGYNNQLWSSYNSGSFDLTISYTAGEQIFFATDAGSDDVNDHGWWSNVQLMTCSETATDSIPPVTTSSLDGLAGNNGWYRSDVQMTLSATDDQDGSGVAATLYKIGAEGPWTAYVSPVTISTEGATTVYYYSRDNAGNAGAVQSIDLNIDKTAPAINGAATMPPDANGWYSSSVIVHFTAGSDLSGIAVITPDVTLSGEGMGQSVTGTVTDNAGNVASFTVGGINIDLTVPATVCSLDGTAGNNGWYMSTVSVTLSASDSLSGVARTEYSLDNGEWAAYTGPFDLSDGVHILKYRSLDNADNVEAALTRTIMVDTVAPVVMITTPIDGAEYLLYQAVTAKWSAADATSGIASSAGTVADGALLNTSGVGAKTFTVIAADDAGNQVTKTVTYNVRYSYSGVLEPISGKTYNSNQALPVKFLLADSKGASVKDAVATLYVARISNGVAGPESKAIAKGNANNGNQFKYADNQYLFNLDPKALGTGTWQLRIALDDGSSKTLVIQIK